MVALASVAMAAFGGGASSTAAAAPSATSTAATSTAGTVTPSADPTTADDTPPGYRLFWSDEFTGNTVDLTRWKPYFNNYGEAGNTLQCNDPANATVGNGFLTITARQQSIQCPGDGTKDYTSAFLGSREAGHYYPTFAKYEIRAKLPHGQGLWPAFWLRHVGGAKVNEVDVFEYFSAVEPGKTRQSLHFPAEMGHGPVTKIPSFFEQPVADTGGDYHTWAVQIVPLDNARKAKFVFSIDGRTTYAYVPSKFGWLDNFDQSAMYDIAVNMAVGGAYTGDPTSQLGYLAGPKLCSLTSLQPPEGNPAKCPTDGIRFQTLPADYDVDYVRVFVPA